jgi:hypothetical protein
MYKGGRERCCLWKERIRVWLSSESFAMFYRRNGRPGCSLCKSKGRRRVQSEKRMRARTPVHMPLQGGSSYLSMVSLLKHGCAFRRLRRYHSSGNLRCLYPCSHMTCRTYPNSVFILNRADCSNCHSITIRSLIVDGNRPLLLRVPKGEALVEMGNAEAQVIQDCRLLEPR